MAPRKTYPNTRKKRRMQYAVLKFLSGVSGRWGAMAISGALCSDTDGDYGGRNEWRLLSTVNNALYRLSQDGHLARTSKPDEGNRMRYVYAITDKGRRELETMEG